MLRLRSRAPFFATLALFARIVLTETCPTAATDGRDLFWNPEFLLSLGQAELDGVMLHEVLHAALLHVPRRGTRDPELWNIAADIVVNGIIAPLPGFSLPKDTLRDKEMEKLSVEEVYELLQRGGGLGEVLCRFRDLLDLPTGATAVELENQWRQARTQAAVLVRSLGQGSLPAGLTRELGCLEPSRLDWRSHLWRYMVRTPTDFSGFDRRFIGRGLYLEGLETETVRVHVGIDTSGSISERELAQFLGEVHGILSAYPDLLCDLYYVDAAAYGPYRLGSGAALPPPQGGGGTDFRPFFAAVERETQAEVEGVCLYLTDGYGAFPEAAPRLPVLWVVTAGGLDLDRFPFGETVRLIPD